MRLSYKLAVDTGKQTGVRGSTVWLSGREWHQELGCGEMDKCQVLPLFPSSFRRENFQQVVSSFKGFEGWAPSFLFYPEDLKIALQFKILYDFISKSALVTLNNRVTTF